MYIFAINNYKIKKSFSSSLKFKVNGKQHWWKRNSHTVVVLRRTKMNTHVERRSELQRRWATTIKNGKEHEWRKEERMEGGREGGNRYRSTLNKTYAKDLSENLDLCGENCLLSKSKTQYSTYWILYINIGHAS